MSFIAAIVGRPNVGKSTLFNRLVGQRLALVDDLPGVTRDRRMGQAHLGDLNFTIIDTAGLDDVRDESLSSRMTAQTMAAVDQADVVLMVIDSRAGVTPQDRHFAALLRRRKAPVVLIANKSEGGKGLAGAYESFELGLGDPIAISAEHGEGLSDLYDALAPFAPEEVPEPEPEPDDEEGEPAEEETRALRFAVVGRPNVGKSTLINYWLGEDRLLTGPEAGITRDSIAVEWIWRDRAVKVFDTAGMRRRSKIDDKLEQLSVADTLRAIRFAEVVVLVIDATMPFDKQDLTIARLIENEGRAIVMAFDKWDLIDNKNLVLADARHKLETSLPQLKDVTLVPICGLTGAGTDDLMAATFETYRIWNKRVPTPQLNRWLAEIQERHPPPLVDGKRLRLRYMTQSNIRPPTFALFASKPGDLPDAYRRYLVNLLRSDFDLPGVPIRVMLRKGANPFAPK